MRAVRVSMEADTGQSIEDAGREAVELATNIGVPVVLTFNDIEIIVYNVDSPHDVAEAYEALREQKYRRNRLGVE